MKKIATDLNQSKRLAKILPIDSADMTCIGTEFVPYPYCESKFKGEDNVYPAWSLAALLNVLPNNEDISINLSKGGYRIPTVEYPNNWFVDYEDKTNGLNNCATSADNPVDACYKMILKLHEMNSL